jgi:hypothetical protein
MKSLRNLFFLLLLGQQVLAANKNLTPPGDPHRIDMSVGTVFITVVGNGTVTSGAAWDDHINCPSDCSGQTPGFAQLFATPAPGWCFLGWSGSASGEQNPLVMDFYSGGNYTATFVLQATITGNPVSQSACPGTGVSFSASATNAVAYRWQINQGFGWFNLWDSGVISNVTTPTLNISDVAGLNGSQYRCTVNGGNCVATNAATLTVHTPPTTANAGPDQTGVATCGLTQVTLAANAPSVGTGQWSIVSGTGGSFANSASPTSTFSGTAGNTYTLRWTITNSPCTASSDNVVITFNRNPTAANAGPDQTGVATCGLTQVTLAANAPSVGTGAWSIVSGSGGSFGNTASPTSTFSGTAGNTYTLRWTTTNSPCTASTDNVVITFNRNPTAANAGPDQTGVATCGLTQVTLAANTPTVGTGQWSIVSGTGGSFANTASPTSTFSGTAGNTYTLRWTISNSPCTASSDNVVITFNRNPTTANAGPDQTGAATCGLTQVTLAANAPTVGTGAWSIVSGTGGSFANTASPTSTFNGTAGNTYTLRWTISNSLCTSTDNVVITFNRNPTTANAGPDQTGAATCGLTQVTLAANAPTVGTGQWSIVSGTGGSFANTASPTSTFSGTAGSTYTLRWTISSSPCTASTDNVVITFNRNPTTANAGPDQTGAATCGLTQVTLAANAPSVGTGQWSIVSGTGGSFANTASPTSTFSGTAGNTYTLRWTITNSPCTASTDNVVITFNRNPTAANAGPDQTGAATCGLTQVTLAANAPTVGTGAWSIVSGTGGSFANTASPTSTFSGTAGNTYTLRWTISSSPCTASSDNVVITFNRNPTTANAGPDQTGAATCGLTQVTLAANTPTVGTGQWSIVSGTGGSFGNTASPTSTFNGTAGNTYTLRWTISNSPCTASTDNVVITFNRNPTTANAGPDQTGAATCGLTQVTLAANAPTVGTGQWSIVSGTGGSFANTASPTSTFSGTAGNTYTLRWTITNSPCTASSDNVVITFNRNPTTANAGPDQTGVATCGLTQVTLAANAPSVGTGQWSIVSGTGGSFGNTASPTSTFSGTAGNTYTLRWTISSSPCTASTDNVVITFNRNPTAANAGPDQTGAATCGLTQVTLAANTPTVGTGQWSIVSGTGGSFANTASPTSTFSGTAGNTYTLRWTISSSPCTASSDNVVITFNRNPTAANAGPDQTGVATCGLTQVTLAANAPTVGTGQWSIVSGTGGSFANTASPTSTFSGTAGNTYTLRWTISSSPCTASTDNVVIIFNRNPTTANAGPDQTGAATCGLTQVTLAANAPSVGTGQWSIVSGTGGSFANTASPTSTFSGTAGNTYTLRWTISSSPCTASTDNVVIIFNRNPTTANAGPDQTGVTTCGLTQVTLAANAPTVGTGQWSIVSGTGGSFANTASPTSTFSGTAGNNYTLRWTISNAPCSASTDDMVVTFNQNPIIDCPQNLTVNFSDPAFALSGGSPAGGTYSGTGVSGDMFDPATAGGGTHTITYAYTNAAGCSGSCTFTITVNTSVSCPGNSTVCFSEPAFALSGGSPAGGTYSGTGVSGGVIDPAAAGAGTHTITYTNGGFCTFTITVIALPPPANAGPDQTGAATCGLSQVTLAANAPTVGTGVWSIVSGTGGSFGNTASPTSTFSGTAGSTYTLRWTISNAPCAASTDDMVITFNQNPIIDCPQNLTVNFSDPAFALSGGSPAGGTYSGTGVSGGMFNPATAGGGTHTITYAHTNAAGCSGSCTFTITVNTSVSCPGNSTVCFSEPAFALSGGSPAGGTYSGTGVSGGVIDPAAAGAGTHTITYTNGGFCTFTITVIALPTPANAGPDQTGAATCGLTQVTLAANAPSVGTGQWSIVSGTGGSFGNTASPTSTFSGTAGSTYTLRWTISNAPCAASTDDMVISFNQNPIIDCPQNLTVNFSDPVFALSGGSPAGGTYSGAGVSGGMFDPATAGGGTHTITYAYTNAAGCSGSCTFTITVNTGSASVQISGAIIWENDNTSGVGSTTVTLSGDQSGSTTTPATGLYALTATSGSNFTVTPTKNINKTQRPHQRRRHGHPATRDELGPVAGPFQTYRRRRE